MADETEVYVAQVEVRFAGKYEGNLSNLRISRQRAITQTGVASGANIAGVGIEKVNVSFDRPVVKDSSKQVSDVMLDGPIDISVTMGDQTWMIFKFRRGGADTTNNPDAGTTSTSYSGSASSWRRIK